MEMTSMSSKSSVRSWFGSTDPRTGKHRPERSGLKVEQLELRELLSSTPAQFVTGLYRDFLGRIGQPSEVASWVTAMSKGKSHEGVATGFINSQEYHDRLVTLDYQRFLQRTPSAAEISAMEGAIAGWINEDQIISRILGSTEYYTNAGGTTDAWFKAVYLNVLNRAPDPTGLLHWKGLMATGWTRTQVALGIAQSDEAHTLAITADYQILLDRQPDASGLSNFVTAMHQWWMTNSYAEVKIAAATEYDTLQTNNIVVPASHMRLWWTPARLTQARAWYAAHPFTPDSTDAYNNALVYLMTGNTQYAQTAINLLMSFTISDSELQGVASDTYRWNDWVPVVYDWLYNQMTPAQQTTFMARYNNYVSIMMTKPWGGPGMDGNNYYWGYLRNEIDWAIATYYENPLAFTFLQDALVTRWDDSFLPWAATDAVGGVTPEGSQYGRYMIGYTVMPFTSLKLLGDDLLQQTNFFKEAAVNLVYTTTTAPTAVKADPSVYYQVFPFGDDENRGGYPDATSFYYGDFMTMAANEWGSQPVGQYARKWLITVNPQVSNYVTAVDQGGPALSFSSLPTDYYTAGATQFLYTRNQWGPQDTSILVKMGQGTRAAHEHLDIGTFQIWQNGYWLSKESTGYSQQFNGGTDSQTISTNGLLFQGIGEANAYADGPAKVLRLESNNVYSYAAVDLNPVYRAHGSPYPGRDDNPYAGTVIREFIYVKPLDTMLVLDRLSSNDANSILAANVNKTFILHVPYMPVVNGNTVLEVNGTEALKMTSLLGANPQINVVDEGNFQGTHYQPSYYQYRVEETTSGTAQSYFLHALQMRSASAADVQIQTTETAASWTITLSDPTRGTAVVILNKGMVSSGGSVAYAASGPPGTPTQLRSSVEPITVTNSGPVWG
jgi:hypothetical protein